jgi:hypothetical protein
MTAREFIQNELLPYLENHNLAYNSYDTRVLAHNSMLFITSNKGKWDKPDTGEVDSYAYNEALKTHGGDEESWKSFQFVEAYERAKLDKATIRESRTVAENLYRGGDKELVEDGILPKPKKPLPALPEKFQFETKYSLAMKRNHRLPSCGI